MSKTPVIELRGHPFTMKPALTVVDGALRDSQTEYAVRAPGYEDWQLAIKRMPSGWRCYSVETHESYSTAFDHGGHTVHAVYKAIRDEYTGRPLGAYRTPERALEALQILFHAGAVMPA